MMSSLPPFSPLALAMLALCTPVRSQELPATQVTVTGSVVQRHAEEAPYAIGVVERDTLREAGPMINLSEVMSRVPGLVVNMRNNYAQDLQISSRGFGARAGFGVRGLRLYADGIPASGPDGQGQVSHFDLAGAQRIEVLRGPFSVLYGNSSGGVIAVFSAPATRAEGEIGLDAGTFGLGQLRGQIALPLGGGFDLRASLAAMSTDGFRPHSSAEKLGGNIRLGWQGASDRVTLIANAVDQPADDPLGLSREQFDADPYQTAQPAIDFNTRKTLHQDQLGASWRHAFGDGALRESVLAVYAGQRAVAAWQSIPPAAQGSPRHGGGVIDFARGYGGVDARLRWGWSGVDVVAGVALDEQRDNRQGYENFTGPANAPTALGVTGALRRDEVNRASSRDVYAQGEFELVPGLAASVGTRSGRVKLSTRDAFLGNGDDSGAVDFQYTNPVAGLRWTAWRNGADSLNLHASAARGSESPTLGELAYRPDGAGGFNEGLRPQRSRQFEVGAKWRTASLGVDATLFSVQVDDEIATLTNTGGRSSFQNVGRTRRQGAELSGRWQAAPAWQAQAALTWLDAHYLDSFLACAGVPCLQPTVVVPAGNRIAGTQQVSAYAELAWRDAGWGTWALEARGVGRTAVNDTNSDFAAGYGVAALRWQKRYAIGAGRQIELLLRVDNLFDKVFAGSVIVNDGNGRYFETGAPRSGLIGIRLLGAL
jgi:iron complex outermembrane receptor protein